MAKNEQKAGPYWTKHWIESMWRFTVENFVEFDTGAVDFEALGREEYEFRKALFYRNFKNSPRAKEAFNEGKKSYEVNVENGNKGGRPPKAKEEEQRAGANSLRGGCHSAPARNSGRKFLNKEEFIQWAIDNGLDPIDANECWEATVERGWKDADGNPIKNIMAYAIQWCKTRETNRRTA